jgi:Creatinase/Prolidase N-terminal domain
MAITELDHAAETEKSKGRAPKPPVEEQEGRLRRARESMERHGLDGLVAYGSAAVDADPIRYLAGYVHVFPGACSLLILPLDGDPVLLIDQPWHLPEAEQMSWLGDVRSFPSPARRWLADELRAAVGGALTGAGLAQGRIGTFDDTMVGPGTAAVALLAAADRPIRAPAAEAALAAGAGEDAALLAVDGLEGYRRALLTELVRRAIRLATERAG